MFELGIGCDFGIDANPSPVEIAAAEASENWGDYPLPVGRTVSYKFPHDGITPPHETDGSLRNAV